MDILASNEHAKLIQHMHAIRYEMDKWVIAETRLLLNAQEKQKFPTRDIVYGLKDRFATYNGKIFVCNATEFLIVIQWHDTSHLELAEKIQDQLPPGKCRVDVFPPNKEGLRRLELNFATMAAADRDYNLARQVRSENIIMVADDDILMRRILRKIIEDTGFTVVDTAYGHTVMSEYLKHLPDVLFLDIHFPDHNGTDILREVLLVDPDAYIVMLSADSTSENVVITRKMGAQGFLTKPVARIKVLNYIAKCKTIHGLTVG